MRRKHFAFLIIAILLALGVWVATRTEVPQPTEIHLPVAAASPVPNDTRTDQLPPMQGRAEARPSQPSRGSSGPPRPTTSTAPTASPLPPDAEAMIEIDKVNLMIRDYRTIAGENPVGTNAEIMAAVMGKNPRQAKLGPPEGIKLNDKGELIDRWGTPYFFHQLSRDHMEIRSAGADRIMWTEDDPVVR
ncbi:MAG: hypothetical protein ACJ8I9_01250 [Chthoniobacterales bacterium]